VTTPGLDFKGPNPRYILILSRLLVYDLIVLATKCRRVDNHNVSISRSYLNMLEETLYKNN
jgi:hypothetical protein